MNLVDRLIPPGDRTSPAQAWRARVLLELMLAATATTLVLAVLYFVSGDWPALLQCAALALVMSGGAVVFRATGAYVGVVRVCLASMAFLFGLVPLLEARLDGASLVWVGALPFTAVVLLGWRAAVPWGFVALASMLLLQFRPEVPWATALTAPGVTLARVLSFIFLVFTMAWAFARSGEGALRDLKSLSAARARFLLRVSHELRTPMSGVVGMTEALRRRLPDVRERDQLGVLAESAEAMTELLDDFLELARLDSGAVRGGEPACEPRRLLESLVALYRPLALQRGISLSAHVDEHVARAFAAEEAALGQVTRTLVGYLLRRVEDGGVLLAIEQVDGQGAPAGGAAVAPGTWGPVGLRFSVRGTARVSSPSGLRSSEGARGLRTPIPRLGQAPASQSALALCGELVEALGGRLEATLSSEEDVQLAFTIPLVPLAPATPATASKALTHASPTVDASVTVAPPSPSSVVSGPAVAQGTDVPAPAPAAVLAPAPAGLPARDAPPASAAPSSAPARRGAPLVLVVDDNPTNVLVACALAKHAGCETITATNGVEAVAAVASQPIALVLMDCHMPVMDGYEATREIRRLPGEKGRIPIIALTAAALPEDLRTCVDAGMNEALTKPARLDQLQRALARWIDASPPVPAGGRDVPRA